MPLVTATRPRQWVKNVLVLAPLLPAGALGSPDPVLGAGTAFLVFCLISSATYLFNDVEDREADRRHPVKRHRPIASGALSPMNARLASAVLVAVGLLLASTRGWELVAVAVTYLVIQVAYCLWMKHEPVLELASVASGFLLRALAGGVAAHVELSQWFLITAAFGSLFVAAGKRYGEAEMGERTGAPVRRVVQRYSRSYLRFVWTMAATVVVISYALWAFDVQAETGSAWGLASMVPFVLAMMRYAVDVDEGSAEEPEGVILHDPVLIGLGLAWVLTLLLAVYT